MPVGPAMTTRQQDPAPRDAARPRPPGRAAAAPNPLLAMQRSAGNRALSQLVAAQRAAASPLQREAGNEDEAVAERDAAAEATPGVQREAAGSAPKPPAAPPSGQPAVQRGLWDSLTGAVSGAVSAVSGAVSSVAQTVGGAVSGAVSAVGSAVTGAVSAVGSAVGSAVRSATDAAASAWQAVKHGAGAIWGAVKSGASSAWQAVKGGAAAAWNTVKGLASRAWEALKSGASSVWNTIKGGASQAWSWLTQQYQRAKRWLAVQRYRMARSARQAFIDRGVRGPKNVRPPTGLGGFAASYDPAAQQLKIGLAGGVTFLDSIVLEGGRAKAKNPGGNMATVVDAINARPRAERAALVTPYQWTADEKAQFVSSFNSRVHEAWSARYPFHATKAYWEDLGAETDVEATLHAGPKGEKEHVSLTSYKVPDDYIGGIGVVNSGAGGATDNTMTLNSNDVTNRNDNLLRWNATFPSGSAALDDAGKARVRAIGGTFREGEKHCATCGAVVGVLDGGSNTMKVRVQGEGADPEANARERYTAVTAELVAGGLTGQNRTTFEYGGVGRRVDFSVGDALAQVVAAHEAGHMFGLGDEYAVQAGSNISGTGAGAGTAAKHDQLAKDMGLKGAVHENNDGIMSLGAVVRPQHYSTFFWALKDVTGMDEWALGPTQAVVDPGEEPAVGDFPTPDRGSAVA